MALQQELSVALLLFDIDGTLIRPMGVGRRAFERALGELYAGRSRQPFPFDGLLDTQIALKTLVAMGIEPTARAVEDLLALYIRRLKDERPPNPEEHLCPGAAALLASAPSRGHDLALLTGNVSQGALLKLAFMGLDGHFRAGREGGDLLGAFGEDAQARAGLVPVAVARCERAFGKRFPPERTWLVGDSPRDVEAARGAGVRCAAVATGLTEPSVLQALKPDLFLLDLSDPAPLWAALNQGTPA